MLKTIIEKAIYDIEIPMKAENADQLIGLQLGMRYTQEEIRAKIPQIADEVVGVIEELPYSHADDNRVYVCREELIKSLTVEKKSDEDNKGV